MARILIVEDTSDLALVIEEALETERHRARVSSTLAEALVHFKAWNPGLVILDLMLPDGDGATFLDRIRAGGWVGPVLILSALSDMKTKLRGFRAGADDYLTKPFGMAELLARVEALLRRVPVTRVQPMKLGGLEIDPDRRQLRVGATVVELRPREMDLLLALAARPDETVSRRRLLVEVWGYSPRAQTRTVDWHVAELRRHIEEAGGPGDAVRTVWGEGYMLSTRGGGEES